MPDSCCREAVFGFEVQVKHGRMGILAAGMMKMNADMGLEGALVCGEPNVAINAKQRTTCRPSVGEEVGTQFVKVRCKIVDEQERGFDHQLVISPLVLGEPFAAVVALQLT